MHNLRRNTPALQFANPPVIASLVAAAAVASLARRARALSPSGSMAATAVGAAILLGAGLRGGGALVTFVASSTLLGRLPRVPGRRQRRGIERDAVQVVANGGVAAVLALAVGLPGNGGRKMGLAAVGGAVAAATADTWATEIGTRFGRRPRSIVTGQPVAAGTSGGVSWVGLLASAVGTATIAAIMSTSALDGQQQDHAPWHAVAIGGFCGALVDSVLGATVQEVRYCDVCREETELPRHACGAPTSTVRGIARFDNDVVNAVATLAGAATAAALTWRSCPPATAPNIHGSERNPLVGRSMTSDI